MKREEGRAEKTEGREVWKGGRAAHQFEHAADRPHSSSTARAAAT